jgi:general secretion pathway protein G
MIKMNRKGFTLIEILIVVAIIAILASIVLVGLGPTQALGRDSRRVSDLAEVQNGLELYYSANGGYPVGQTSWGKLTTTLEGAGVGVNAVPDDPSSGVDYVYSGTSASPTYATTYVLQAGMESSKDGFWASYNPPSAADLALLAKSNTTGGTIPTCGSAGVPTGNSPYLYCVAL